MDAPRKPVFPSDDARFKITPIQQMGAACTGGILSAFLITPLDVLKVRLQAQQRSSGVVHKCYLYCNGLANHICPCLYSRPSQYSGTFDAAVKMVRFEGITSLWSGLLPTLILTVPATIIYFVSYDQLKSRLSDLSNATPSSKTAAPPPWISSVAGGTARMLSLITVSPLELVRTKMQSEKLSYFQMNEAVQSLIRKDGVTGLWKGIIPTLIIDEKHAICSFLGGAISGAIGALMTNPFDVVKTIYQTDFMNNHLSHPGKRQTVLRTLRTVYRTRGIVGLYSGLTPRLVKVIPQCAITVSSFEMGKRFFQQRNLNRRLHSMNETEESISLKET